MVAMNGETKMRCEKVVMTYAQDSINYARQMTPTYAQDYQLCWPNDFRGGHQF
jgi:hypothetical protein